MSASSPLATEFTVPSSLWTAIAPAGANSASAATAAIAAPVLIESPPASLRYEKVPRHVWAGAASRMADMLSLYRRHRPRSFDQVVGQEHIVRTLRNAIELGKVHHAYLFVGSRGTGKTSMAKLLACAMNAEGGPSATFDPDNQRARAIMGGQSLDVVEMDAASNNSV